jgi:hypothetical protein
MDWQAFSFDLLDSEPNIWGVAVLEEGRILYQTENWDLAEDVSLMASVLGGEEPGRLTVMKLGYAIVEQVPERIIATSVTKKGHVVIIPAGKRALVVFVNPSTAVREVLFNLQELGKKITA